MTIEIHQPKLEALIQARMASGHFHSIEDALLQALESAPFPRTPGHAPDDAPEAPLGQRLIEACAMIQGLTDDVGFERPPSAWRPLELA